MFLVGQLAKVQGLKGEMLLHAVGDDVERLPERQGLVLAPPEMDLQEATSASAPARPVVVRSFRWHQDRPCITFEGVPDRTAAESLKGWALWMPEHQAELPEGESFRHDWIGCNAYVGGQKVGEVLRLEPTTMGYDMVILRDTRPGRHGQREIPFIKAWFTLDLPQRRLDMELPPGLLEINEPDASISSHDA